MPIRLKKEDGKSWQGVTWIHPEELAYDTPLKYSARQGIVRWPDKKLRKVRLGIADTYFTIPARGKKDHKTYHGFIHLDTELGEYIFTPLGKYKDTLKW